MEGSCLGRPDQGKAMAGSCSSVCSHPFSIALFVILQIAAESVLQS